MTRGACPNTQLTIVSRPQWNGLICFLAYFANLCINYASVRNPACMTSRLAPLRQSEKESD